MDSSRRLPTKLGKEPLVSAAFELRFQSTAPAASVIPGILYSASPDGCQLSQFLQAGIPQQIRDADPNFAYAPLVGLDWNEYQVLVGDRMLQVLCKHPYVGWTSFQSAILKVLDKVKTIGILSQIDRFSLKYVDILEEPSDALLSHINLGIQIAAHTYTNESLLLRVEIPQGRFIHGLQVASSATANWGGASAPTTRSGIMIDVDTICMKNSSTFDAFMQSVQVDLHDAHEYNKKMFFDCLTDAGLEKLEPSYE